MDIAEVFTIAISLMWCLCAVFLARCAFSLFSDVVDERAEKAQLTSGAANTEIYLGISPETFRSSQIFLFGTFFLLGCWMVNVALGLLLGLAAWFAPVLLLERFRKKRVRQVERQLVEGLELLGNALKSGLTLPQASQLLVEEFPAPIAEEFTMVLGENRLGIDFNEALKNMASRLDSNIIQILASGVAITRRCGGDLPSIFQNISNTIREQAKVEGKLEAVTAQGRSQGFVLSIMPFALIGVLYVVDRAHVETLFGYQVGLWAVMAVILMVGIAQLWIRKLLALDV